MKLLDQRMKQIQDSKDVLCRVLKEEKISVSAFKQASKAAITYTSDMLDKAAPAYGETQDDLFMSRPQTRA